MSQPPHSSARWIVVPPFREDTAWRASVTAAAAEAGLRLHDLDVAPEGAPINDPNALIMTSDAQRALDAGVSPSELAGLVAGFGMRIGNEDGADALLSNVIGLTDLMARTALLPSNRLFRVADFNSGPTEILPGLTLQRPILAPDVSLSPRQKALIGATALLDPAMPQATWMPELFNYDSRTVAGGTCGQLDLTGRPRFMITGPYITLPSGRWRATYRLTFDARGSRPRFRVDWGTQADYISEEFVPGRAGVFEIVQDYVWTERAPSELRVIVLEGVFDGKMTFSGAEVSRVG